LVKFYRIYGDDNVRNITLAKQELLVLKKLGEIRLKMAKKTKEMDIEYIKVNPFLSMMYFNLSFKAWRNRTRRSTYINNRKQDPTVENEVFDDESSLRSEETFRMSLVDSDEENENIKIEDRSGSSSFNNLY
jgi:hypothetical protein